MPEFHYQGVNKLGKKVSGKIDAPNEGELRMVLRGMGVRPVQIKKASILNTDLSSLLRGGVSVSNQTLVPFTRQLYVLVSSGIPLVQALDDLADQAIDKGFQRILIAVKEKVSGGAFFWESLAAYPNAFPRIYVALIRAGETSGALETILKRLSRYLEDSERLRKMVRGAMIYPVIVISIGIAVISAMMIFVIPRFEALLASSGQQLPAITQMVINSSHFVIDRIAWLLIGGATSLYLLFRYIKSDEGRAVMHRLFYRVPLFGEVIKKGGVARFSRTMGTLLSAGVTIIDAIEICKATVDNVVLEEAISKIRGEVESGKSMGSTLRKLPAFPKMATQMISVGESTGNLDIMLEKVADFYEQEVENLVSGMSKLIEPLVLVVLGGLVGGMMIAMYLPVFQLAGGGGE